MNEYFDFFVLILLQPVPIHDLAWLLNTPEGNLVFDKFIADYIRFLEEVAKLENELDKIIEERVQIIIDDIQFKIRMQEFHTEVVPFDLSNDNITITQKFHNKWK